MVDKVTVSINSKKQKAWPSRGDIFFVKTGSEYYLGQVLSDKMSIGPFKNALITCIYSDSYSTLPEINVIRSESLLIPPVITDNSCWKNGLFQSVGSSMVNEELLNRFLFVNPLNNRAYGLDDKIYEGNRHGMIIGERSLFFDTEIVKRIEGVLN